MIRSLGRLGIDVYGVHESRLAPAASSRYLAGRCYWRPSVEDEARALEGLHAIASRIGRRSVLFTTDDAGAIFVAEHREVLSRWFSFPQPDVPLPRRLAGKLSMYELCQELGVPCPKVQLAGSRAEATAFADASGFPVVAKLASPWQGKGGKLRSTQLVHDRTALDELLAEAERLGVEYLLQEYVPGGTDADWFFHGYCDADSRCAPAFTGVKHRSYPAHAGLTSFGVSRRNEALRAQVCDVLERISYRGIMDLDIRYDVRDDTYKLLDFNPRLGAQFRIFTTTSDVDVAVAQYLDLTGQSIPSGEQLDDRGFVVEAYDAMSAIGYARQGELDLRGWLSSLRGVDETAWFAKDDLRPFGLMCVRMGWRLATRPLAARVSRDDGPRFATGRAKADRASVPSSAPQQVVGPEGSFEAGLRRAA